MMTAGSRSIPCVPKETARAASATFGRGNFYIQVGEHLDSIYGDLLRTCPQPEPQGRPTEDPTLPLVTFFQFMEGLTDLQAMDAVRTRTDWKFALHLSLIPRMLQEDELCQFRQRILVDAADRQKYQVLIDRLGRFVPARKNDSQQVNSLELVSLVCSLNRMNHAQQAMNGALEVLAARFPEWLCKIAQPHWYGRYNPAIARLDMAILLGQQRFLIEEIGADIQHLLTRVREAALPDLSALQEIQALEQIWSKLFQTTQGTQTDRLKSLCHKDCEICSYKGGKRPT